MSGGRGLDLSIAVGAYVAAGLVHLGLLGVVAHFGGGPAPAEAAGRIDVVTLPPRAAITALPPETVDGMSKGDAAERIAAVAPSPQASAVAASGGKLLTLLPVDEAEPSSSPDSPKPATPVTPVANAVQPDALPAESSRDAPTADAVPPTPMPPAHERREVAPETSADLASALRPVETNSVKPVRPTASSVETEVAPTRALSPTGSFERPTATATSRVATVAAGERTAGLQSPPADPVRPLSPTANVAVRSDGLQSDRPGTFVPAATAPAAARAPSRGGSEALQPVRPMAGRASGASPRVAAIAPRASPDTSETAAAIGRTGAGREVRDFLRGYGTGGCFIAVATQVEKDRFAVSGFSRTEAEWTAFNRALDERTGYRFASRSRQVSKAQCAALAFAHRQPDYPAFATRIALESDRLQSGGEIAGRVSSPPSRRLTLLLVDDEGLVQDVTSLLRTAADGGMTFRTPLTLTSGPVETVQLFVALASEGAIDAIPADGSLKATDYFAALSRTTEGRNEGIDVALAAFSVE